MTQRFSRAADLPLANVTRQDFYDLVEQIKPLLALLDGSDAATDQTLEVNSDLIRAALKVPRWKKFSISHDDLTVAANNETEVLFALGTTGYVHAVYMKHSEAFTGGGATLVTASVGDAGDPSLYAGAFNVFQAPAAAANQYNTITDSDAAINVPGISVQVQFQSTGAYCNALTTGEMDVWVLYSEMP